MTHLLLAVLTAAFCWTAVVTRPEGRAPNQWDFRTFYHAAKAWNSGLNPYSQQDLARVAGVSDPLPPFLYPPITLPFFSLFLSMDYSHAFYAWLLFKSLLLVGLVYIWKTFFLQLEMNWVFYPFLVMAFNHSLFVDFLAGNVSLVEQVLLWAGLACFLRGRILYFILCISAASLFKLTPLAFLLLLLLTEYPNKVRWLISAVLSNAAAWALFYLFDPMGYSRFLGQSWMNERGNTNPSTFNIVRDIGDMVFQDKLGIFIPYEGEVMVYLALAATVVWMTRRFYLRYRDTVKDPEKQRKMLIFLACLVYALVLPRFKNYSFILLIAPTYYLLRKASHLKLNHALFIMAIFTCDTFDYIFFPQVAPMIFLIIYQYFALITAVSVWVAYMMELKREGFR